MTRKKHKGSSIVKIAQTFLIMLGCYGVYLALYGSFRLSLAGWIGGALLAALMVVLDYKFEGWSRSIKGGVSGIGAIVSGGFYLLISGYILMQGAHALTFKVAEYPVKGYLQVRTSSRAKFCKYQLNIEDVSNSRRRICLGREEYTKIAAISKLGIYDGSMSLILKIEASMFGSKVYI